MKLQIFSVRDRATNQFGNPMFLINVGQAIRSFADEINSGVKTPGERNMLAQHPDDFDLFHLGEFESDEGVFTSHTPRQVAVGKDLVVKS